MESRIDYWYTNMTDLEAYLSDLLDSPVDFNWYRIAGNRYVAAIRVHNLGISLNVDVTHFNGLAGSPSYRLSDNARRVVGRILHDDAAMADWMEYQDEGMAAMRGVL